MTSALAAHTEEAVKRFLQSVMVIDDQATYPGAVRQAVSELRDPGSAVPAEGEGDDLAGEDLEPTTRPDALDAQTLIESFAQMGLVCGIMRPEPPAELDERRTVLPAAARADIVILDWQMGDDGGHALRILKGLSERTGLRLAAVYTYKSELLDIASAIEAGIDGARDGFRVTKDDFAVEVYAKDTATIEGEGRERIQPPDRLAHTLIADFARLTRGIVPTSAVAAIGALRHGTPRVLGLLNGALDAGFLGHRVLLADPDDAERQLLDLIGSELRTVIEDDELVRRVIGMEGMAAYVREMPEGMLSRELVLRMLEIGTGRDEAAAEFQALSEIQEVPPVPGSKKAYAVGHTRLFTGGNDDQAREADLLFARRMLLRSDTKRPPVLQLGTILKRTDEWFVCVQPDCDSVRIDASREFPLVRASRTSLGPGVDLVVRHDGEDLGLRVDLHLYAMDKVAFPPRTETRTVNASGEPGCWTFQATNGDVFDYVAQLRRDHSHRLAQDFAAHGARVGLDESELIRRWGEKK